MKRKRTVSTSMFALLAASAFDPTQLHCLLTDKTLSSEISFSTDNNVLVGEVDNYVESDHQKKLISGDLLFNLKIKGTTIQGKVGDPRGTSDNFTLEKRNKNIDGAWMFQSLDDSGRVSKAIFECTYDSKKR